MVNSCGSPQLWFRRRVWRLQRQSSLQFPVHAPSGARAWLDGDWLYLWHRNFALSDVSQRETLLERFFVVFRRVSCGWALPDAITGLGDRERPLRCADVGCLTVALSRRAVFFDLAGQLGHEFKAAGFGGFAQKFSFKRGSCAVPPKIPCCLLLSGTCGPSIGRVGSGRWSAGGTWVGLVWSAKQRVVAFALCRARRHRC